ncbi:MAG TPA: extracellular solute-binding protein, partial [Anaerolineae bacterium]|nr:extracellular solute-binding protein [Anaerolineae bacterium]
MQTRPYENRATIDTETMMNLRSLNPGWRIYGWLAVVLLASACVIVERPGPSSLPVEPVETVTLRLGVALTPQELETFQAAITTLDKAHPEWEIVLETIPQQGAAEKINTQLAANELPDVLRVAGLQAQQWIRQEAFLDLTPFAEESGLDLDDFYPGPL